MRIKTLFILFIAVSLIFTCGCWDYREYENLAMVSAVGFDIDNSTSTVTVTMQYLVPAGNNITAQTNGGSPKPTTGTAVVIATGPSIDDALQKIQQVTGKKLFYGYMQEIVVGGNAARHITKDIIEYIDRTPNIRTSAYIAITQGKAEDVLDTIDPNATEPPSKEIHGLIDESINSGSAYPVTIQSFEENLVISGEEPVAPEISAVETGESNNSSSSSSTSSGSSLNSSSSDSSENTGNSFNGSAYVIDKQKNGYFKIDGIAVFQSDKLVGQLDGNECLGLGWITNQNYYLYEVVKTSSEQNVMNTLIFRVTNSNCKIKVELENDKPVVNINAYVEADLRKFSNNINADYLTPDVMEMMEKGLADNVRTDINAAIEKGQKELKSDIFCFGFDFYRQEPNLWHSEYEKKWEQIFPTLKINVNVSAKVVDTGTSINKLEPK
jgi:spore germination protein KC